MQKTAVRKRIKKLVLVTGAVLLLLFAVLLFWVNRYVEPMLRDRLHTLIVQGSDSLYHYTLGDLDANFFGGNVAVENLHIEVDSNRYRQLAAAHALPSLSFQLDLKRGHIKGLGVAALMFGKKVQITEILSHEADVKLSRHVRDQDAPSKTLPLWKTLQPAIRGIEIDRINLDGIKLLYRNADTSESVKLQFDRCEALFEDVRIDSLAESDTTRLAFTKNIQLQFNDLKFRTSDSAYKMKAEQIVYSSQKRYLEIIDFKVQPTLKREAFYTSLGHQESHYVIQFEKAWFTNLRLDRFVYNNIIVADSLVVDSADIDIYNDKTLPQNYENKFGTYPHQKLLGAKSTVMLRGIRMNDARLRYTEQSDKTMQEGTLAFTNMDVRISNVTNDSNLIRQNPRCTALAEAYIFDKSPVRAAFTFHLDSTEGEFDVAGEIRNVTATQLNTVAVPFSNTSIQSGTIQSVRFRIQGDDFTGRGQVDMQYNNLSVVLRKRDEETGANKTKKFLTKLLNKFTLWSSNPGPDGIARRGSEVLFARSSSKSFFGLIWKTLFKGMQDVMMKSGRYE